MVRSRINENLDHDDVYGDDRTLINKSKTNRKKCICLSCLGSLIVLIGIAVVVLVSFHASCKIIWQFDENCDGIRKAIVQQIHNWTGDSNCQDGGEKCLYKLLSDSSETVTAYHLTPKARFRDNMRFTFGNFSESHLQCQVVGYSTSTIFFAVLDFGTNYCNLHNLIIGSQLDKVQGYHEATSDSICTQYSSANCTHY